MTYKQYKLTIYGQLKGLNELLDGRYYDHRSRRYHNKVKHDNDAICIDAIRFSRSLRGVHITDPIIIEYRIFAKDKKHDRMNLGSAVDKSFQDALQKTRVIDNDGWDDVIGASFSYFIDRKNPRTEVTIIETDLRQ